MVSISVKPLATPTHRHRFRPLPVPGLMPIFRSNSFMPLLSFQTTVVGCGSRENSVCAVSNEWLSAPSTPTITLPNQSSSDSCWTISGNAEPTLFKIYNLLGEEIESSVVYSNRGVNTIYVNTSLYPEGMYLYSINNGKQILTKRMVVSN